MMPASSTQHRFDFFNAVICTMYSLLQVSPGKSPEDTVGNRCVNDGANLHIIRHAIMRSAAACDGDLRQRRLIWSGAAYRLAVAALPPLAYVASSLGYELDRVVQELDNQSHQAQKSIQPVHRQFTSSQGRRRCRLAGLTPLAYRYYSRSDTIIQTYVRIVEMASFFSGIRTCRISCPYVAYKKPGKTSLGTWRPLRKESRLLYPTSQHNRKAA